MNHMLSVCFFHFVRSLDGVEASEKARQNLEALDNLLATGWEREGRDTLPGDDRRQPGRRRRLTWTISGPAATPPP